MVAGGELALESKEGGVRRRGEVESEEGSGKSHGRTLFVGAELDIGERCQLTSIAANNTGVRKGKANRSQPEIATETRVPSSTQVWAALLGAPSHMGKQGGTFPNFRGSE